MPKGADYNEASSSMSFVELTRLKPGMILARTVYDFQKRLLFQPGAELSQKHIWVLKSWGVTGVWIKKEAGQTYPGSSESLREIRKIVFNRMKQKFAHTLQDPIMTEIMRVACRQAEKRLKTEQPEEIQ